MHTPPLPFGKGEGKKITRRGECCVSLFLVGGCGYNL